MTQTVPSADGTTLRIRGHGVYPAPPAPRNERNGTQQTDSGPYQSKVGTTVKYRVDTTGGNSGSAVEHVPDSLVYAIHTHGGCTFTGGTNKGTAVDHPGLQGALACPIGVCAEDCNSNGIYDQCDMDCLSPCGGCNVPGCGESNDCNLNNVPDECDIASGSSEDCNANGIPDECEGTTGACCMGGGSCQELLEACCADAGGSFLGTGTVCNTQVGACCAELIPGFPKCKQRTECSCEQIGGDFYPFDNCATFNCPTELGPQPGG